MVVLAVHPRRIGDVRRAEQREQLAADVGAGGEPRAEVGGGITSEPCFVVGRAGEGTVIDGTVAEAADRDVGDRGAVRGDLRGLVADRRRRVRAGHADGVEEAVVHPEASGVGDAPDDRRADLPAVAQREHLVEVVGCHDRQHPLLALGREHLHRVHARLPMGRTGDVDVHAGAGLGRGLGRRARDAGGSEVLHPDREPRVEQREARLDELLLLERIPDLDGRSLGLAALLEAGRREDARAADAVAPGRRAEQHREVADALGAREHEPVDGERAEAEDVDERVVAVALVEDELAADGGHADRVAVAADPAHDALEEVTRPRVVERAETQRVHERDRPGPHREDVADDPADAGRRALVGLHRGRMVVTLDPHGDRDAVADVDDPRALTRPDEDPRRLGREAPEVGSGRLVRAVLRPHHRVHRQLEVGRLATELVDHPGELVVGHAELPVQGGLRHSRRDYRRAPSVPGPFVRRPRRPVDPCIRTKSRLCGEPIHEHMTRRGYPEWLYQDCENAMGIIEHHHRA